MKNIVLGGFHFSKVSEKELILESRKTTLHIDKKFNKFQKGRFYFTNISDITLNILP